MNEDEAKQRLGAALDRLHAFAASFSPTDVVDQDSKLTGDDLHVILDLAEKIHRMAVDAPSDLPQRIIVRDTRAKGRAGG